MVMFPSIDLMWDPWEDLDDLRTMQMESLEESEESGFPRVNVWVKNAEVVTVVRKKKDPFPNCVEAEPVEAELVREGDTGSKPQIVPEAVYDAEIVHDEPAPVEPDVDLFETRDHFMLIADMPGVGE